MIAEEAASNPRFRQKIAEALDLHGLLEHEGWKALKKHHEIGTEGFGKGLAARQLAGEEVSQREIDYYRGAREMAEAIFKYPEIALANLERTAERLLTKKFEEQVAEHFAASPYTEDQEV